MKILFFTILFSLFSSNGFSMEEAKFKFYSHWLQLAHNKADAFKSDSKRRSEFTLLDLWNNFSSHNANSWLKDHESFVLYVIKFDWGIRNSPGISNCMTLFLNLAVSENMPLLVAMILSQGVDPNFFHAGSDFSLLHYAAEHHFQVIVRLLLCYGAKE